jgi:hypothetical protein
MDRVHEFLSIAHVQYGAQKFVGNFHHVRFSEFGEFFQLFFYEAIDLRKMPPLMKTMDVYATSPSVLELYQKLMPKGSYWLVSQDELKVTYAHGAGVDIATASIETTSGPLRQANVVLLAKNPVYGISEFFTTLDLHFGDVKDVEDGIDGAVSSEVTAHGSLEMANGERLEATAGVPVPSVYLYFGPYRERPRKVERR